MMTFVKTISHQDVIKSVTCKKTDRRIQNPVSHLRCIILQIFLTIFMLDILQGFEYAYKTEIIFRLFATF